MRKAYQAVWYERAEIEALARKRGMAEGDSGSLFDYVSPEDERLEKGRIFRSKALAVAFLQTEIIAGGRDVFGQCEILELTKVERRCRYCTCHGQQVTARAWVDNESVSEQEARPDECLN